MPSSSPSFLRNSDMVTPMRDPFAQGLYMSVCAPKDSGLMRIPHSIFFLLFLLWALMTPLYFFQREKELKIKWSEYFRCSLMSRLSYAGANVCPSLPNFSYPSRASFTELAHTPSRYLMMSFDDFHPANPFRARRTMHPVLSLTFFRIFRFSS